MEQPTCMGCRFVNITSDDDAPDALVIECRRYPPSFLPGDGAFGGMAHVAVSPDGWCGEHQPDKVD